MVDSPEGPRRAWQHPNVQAVRTKLADAMTGAKGPTVTVELNATDMTVIMLGLADLKLLDESSRARVEPEAVDASIVVTAKMGPAHVGPDDLDTPTLMNYPTIGDALRAQDSFLRRHARTDSIGRASIIYLGDDGEEKYPVGRLTFVGWQMPECEVPLIQWSWEPGFEGEL